MQVAYRPAAVRRLGPSSFKYRSNSTASSTQSKTSYKASSWGDLVLPGRGDLAKKNASSSPIASATRPTPVGSLSDRMSQWTKPAASQKTTSSEDKSKKEDPSPSADDFQPLSLEGEQVHLKMAPWMRRVERLGPPDTNPKKVGGFFAGAQWVPGQELPTLPAKPQRNRASSRPRDSDSQRTPRAPRRQQLDSGEFSMAFEGGGGERTRRARQPVRDRRLRTAGNASATTPTARRPFPPKIQEARREEVLYTGEEGIFEPQRGQSEEAWLEMLAQEMHATPVGNTQADIDIASTSSDLFRTRPLIPSLVLKAPAASPKKSTQVVKRRVDAPSPIPSVRATGLRDLRILGHAHLLIAKQRDTQLTQKKVAIKQIKSITP